MVKEASESILPCVVNKEADVVGEETSLPDHCKPESVTMATQTISQSVSKYSFVQSLLASVPKLARNKGLASTGLGSQKSVRIRDGINLGRQQQSPYIVPAKNKKHQSRKNQKVVNKKQPLTRNKGKIVIQCPPSFDPFQSVLQWKLDRFYHKMHSGVSAWLLGSTTLTNDQMLFLASA